MRHGNVLAGLFLAYSSGYHTASLEPAIAAQISLWQESLSLTPYLAEHDPIS